MSEIPEDVRREAKREFEAWDTGRGQGGVIGCIERAILAERERCAKIAEDHLSTTGLLLCEPPKSKAAYIIWRKILSGTSPS